MISLDAVSFVGSNLVRPECILCTQAGFLYTSDFRGGVSRIALDGTVTSFLADSDDFLVQPNGIALMQDGSFLLAHLGKKDGGVYRLERDGILTPFLLEVDGESLPPTNYVHLDAQGRIWITVSTRLIPRHLGYRPDACDGFMVLVDKKGARIVADELGYTNECLVHPSGRWLYVNETFARKVTRFEIDERGNVKNKETITEFGNGVFPDGLAFDQEGAVWITSIVSNKIIRVDPNGQQEVMLQDCDEDHVAWVEDAFQKGEMGRPHLDQAKSKCLKNISSLAFGGPDLKTIYLGCLLGDQIATCSSPVAGIPPAHWEFDN